QIPVSDSCTQVSIISPDFADTVFVPYTYENNTISFTMPSLEYYNVIILDYGILLPPSNLIIQIIDNEIHLSWNLVQGATSYRVFSSDNPETGFEVISGEIYTTSWSCEITENKKFYYVTAVN
ncbi:MAG: hypothetical protein KAW88_10165, partial [Candidatus Cloacimonetes bacterium]|nr:hypothetical protein [Candidatus Cloacimonadota bacterium]